MARIEILHKHIMVARERARRESNARVTGESIYIKRSCGKYLLVGVHVTKKQRKCRDIFADAQKLASYELKQWNKKRHWGRIARAHKIKGAHRMAVSHYYRILKDNGLELDEALRLIREKRFVDSKRKLAIIVGFGDWNQRENEESPFFYKKFCDIGEYYGAVMRMAG